MIETILRIFLTLCLLYPLFKWIFIYLIQQQGKFYEICTASSVRSELLQKVKSLLKKNKHFPSLMELCDYNGILQTSIGLGIRTVSRKIWPMVRYQREYVTMMDGGTIALDWGTLRDSSIKSIEAIPKEKVVIILPGLLGNSKSEYIYFLIPQLIAAGYSPVVYVARGNGGVPITSDSLYSGKIADDLYEAIRYIRIKYFPDADLPLHPNGRHPRDNHLLFAVGFSLGAAGVINYASKMKDHTFLDAIVSVGPPLYAVDKTFITTWLSDMFSSVIGLPLKMYFRKHYPHLVKHNPTIEKMISHEKILKVKTIAEYNEHLYKIAYRSALKINYHREKSEKITKHNISDKNHKPIKSTERCEKVMDYYEDGSPAREALQSIEVPTLVLSAKDDPVCLHENIPSSGDKDCEIFGPSMIVVKTNFGGHLCFPQLTSWTTAWSDRMIIDWFDSFAQNDSSSSPSSSSQQR